MSVSSLDHTGYSEVGSMSMPPDFKYRDTYFHGRPQHEPLSRFLMRHPSMSCSKRAKLFAPFEALKYFGDRIENKEVLYVRRKELSREAQENLNRKIQLLHSMLYTRSGFHRRSLFPVTVTFFSPCKDKEHEAYGSGGTYEKITGKIRRIDTRITNTIQIEETTIPLSDVAEISGDLFRLLERREV